MAFTKITQAEINKSGVSGLPNKPTMGAQKLKEAFDSPGKEVLYPAYNRLIDELQEENSASSLGATVPEGIAAEKNIQSVVNAIVDKVNITGEVAHTHPNKALLDTYTQTNEDLADAVEKKHVHENKELLDSYTQSNASIVDAVEKKHVHANKELLDSYSQEDSDLTDAVVKKHAHANKNVLDKFSEADGKPQYDGKPIGGGSGADVSWSQYVSSGTKIASIDINGETTDVYAPTSGGGGASSYASLDDKPSLGGKEIIGSHDAAYYGLATASAVSELDTNKADKSNTLAGYGITNAYTKTEVNTKLSEKVNEPSSEGEDGYALLTDGNGGRHWGAVASDVKTDEVNLTKNENNELTFTSEVNEKLTKLDDINDATKNSTNYATAYQVQTFANEYVEQVSCWIAPPDNTKGTWQNVPPEDFEVNQENFWLLPQFYVEDDEEVEISFGFEPNESGQVIFIGGYQFVPQSDIVDEHNRKCGGLCFYLANELDAPTKINVKMRHLRNGYVSEDDGNVHTSHKNVTVDYGTITSQASHIKCVVNGQSTDVETALNNLSNPIMDLIADISTTSGGDAQYQANIPVTFSENILNYRKIIIYGFYLRNDGKRQSFVSREIPSTFFKELEKGVVCAYSAGGNDNLAIELDYVSDTQATFFKWCGSIYNANNIYCKIYGAN